MTLRRPILLIVTIVIYLVAVYVVYSGPLSVLLPAGSSVLQDIIWNYGVLALFFVLLWTLSRFIPKREIPKLLDSRSRSVLFGVSLALYMLIMVFFWQWEIVNAIPLIFKFEVLIYNNLMRYLSPEASSTIINAVLAMPITIFVIVFVIWQLRGWYRQIFSFSWRDGITTLLLLAFSTFASYCRNLFIYHQNSVQSLFPSGGVINVLILLVSQSLVNGIPEELYFRGYMIPQLLVWLRNPFVVGLIMVSLFDASHIPSAVIGQGLHLPWWQWILWSLFELQPTGWLFFIIYYRMRSVIPGAIYHTYATLWAFPFLW